MSYNELSVALENIIADKVATVPTARSRKHDTRAPMEIGMAAKEDGENASQEGDQRIVGPALQAVYKGTGFGKGQSWSEKGGKGGIGGKGGKDGGKNPGRKAVARKEAKGKKKVAREKPERIGRVTRQDTLQHGAGKVPTTFCTPSMKTTVKTSKNQLTTKKICKHGVCWKKVKMSSLKR